VASDRNGQPQYTAPIRNILIGLLAVALIAVFTLWRVDSPRVERLRADIVDRIVPGFEWAMRPATTVAGMVDELRSFARVYEQNQELRRELQQMKAWREAALQLEQKNAKLLDLNQVRVDPRLTHVTGIVMADSGSPFRQSVLLNVGRRDGIRDGWATMDGLGLVGRISGVGRQTARVVLLTDSNSRVPVTIQPSGQRAVLTGDNTRLPLADFIESPELVRPGDRVVTSGDGSVFPSGLLVGELARGADRHWRVRLAADYERLEFLRVLRSRPIEQIPDAGTLIAPLQAPQGPPEAAAGDRPAQRPTERADG